MFGHGGPDLEKQKAADNKENQEDEGPMQKELLWAVVPPHPLMEHHSIRIGISSSIKSSNGRRRRRPIIRKAMVILREATKLEPEECRKKAEARRE